MPKIAKKKTQSRKTLAREGMAEMIDETSTCVRRRGGGRWWEMVRDGGGRWREAKGGSVRVEGWQHARL